MPSFTGTVRGRALQSPVYRHETDTEASAVTRGLLGRIITIQNTKEGRRSLAHLVKVRAETCPCFIESLDEGAGAVYMLYIDGADALAEFLAVLRSWNVPEAQHEQGAARHCGARRQVPLLVSDEQPLAVGAPRGPASGSGGGEGWKPKPRALPANTADALALHAAQTGRAFVAGRKRHEGDESDMRELADKAERDLQAIIRPMMVEAGLPYDAVGVRNAVRERVCAFFKTEGRYPTLAELVAQPA